MINRYQYDANYTSKRSPMMERTARTLGIISIFSCWLLYVSLPCGAMAIILAFLSVGGSRSMSSRAVKAAIFGALGLGLTISIYCYSVIVLLQQYGSWEGIVEAVYKQYGLVM